MPKPSLSPLQSWLLAIYTVATAFSAPLATSLPAGLPAPLAALDDPAAMAALGRAAGALAPRLGGLRAAGPGSQPVAPEATLLAQQEATTHRPVSYTSSPSLPGTLNAPWWTDFAHLVYWFYVVATFTTVAFLGYLYDLLVRRREAAHPIRETRGFSRAQTGDLVTAVLPLTWSATMVMHASTHSINFDENTAGAAFSFTVIAYQWGWNYYFPRDVVSQMEAAPRIVGRGRVVKFSPTPLETAEAAAADLWAMRATVGARHGSRTGRLNASSALSLTLPTDLPAGALSALPAGASWRAAAAAGLGEVVPSPASGGALGASALTSPVGGLEVVTSALARPSAFVSGDRLVLGARHYAASSALPSAPRAAAWAAAAPQGVAPQAPGRPLLAHLSGALAEGRPLAPQAPLAEGLDLLRGAQPSRPGQLLLWTGPDAVTGAGSTALASTEDMGWLTPLPAREATARATLATGHAWAETLPPRALEGRTPGPLLLPFDLTARDLLAHVGGSVPVSWIGASAALESEIGPDSQALWAGGLVPDLSAGALLSGRAGAAESSPAGALLRAPRPMAPALAPALALSPLAPAPAPAGASPLLALGAGLGLPRSPLPGVGGVGGASLPGALRGAGARPEGFGPLTPTEVGAAAAAAPARAPVGPSGPGLGLDEARLVRSAASRLSDPALVAGKVDAPTGPFTALPLGPLGLLGLGWSTTASLATYPSFKMARGGILRRPMVGLRGAPAPHQGLSAPLAAPLLGKVGAPLGRPQLQLWAPLDVPAASVGSPLEGASMAWASSWAFTGPAPAEDLDPAFINTVWTPETNTTRRSDHNSRYLVTWAPLGAALTQGGAFAPTQSGPGARAPLAPLAVRTSLLALNETGLKNTAGGSGAKASLAALTLPQPTLGGAGAPAAWPALWAFTPAFGPAPAVFVGQPRGAAWTAGRSGSLLTAQARAAVHGALSPELSSVSSGSSLTSLIAALDLVRMTGPDHPPLARQGYVPLSSSISSSRRLRVTKGISLPSDTPMHIICGSKDVIHSWAIPGLGVKIDCIPGYNSHRRLLLRWRGAYWGQCMEVCGRYHHWMPIMVNVVHPALFADWCLTFLRGLDTQAHSGSVGPTPQALTHLLGALQGGR